MGDWVSLGGSRNGAAWLGFLQTNGFAALQALEWAWMWWRRYK